MNDTQREKAKRNSTGPAKTFQPNHKQQAELAVLGILSVILMFSIDAVLPRSSDQDMHVATWDTEYGVAVEGTPALDHVVDLSQDNQAVLQQQEQVQLERFNTELKHLDEYVLKQRQNIEDWYANNLANLQRWAKEVLNQLDGKERDSWARYCQNMQNIISHTTGRVRTDTYGYANTYFIGDRWATTSGYVATEGHSLSTTQTSVVGDPAGQYASEFREIKNCKDDIQLEFLKLQKQREGYLAEVESYADNVRKRVLAENRQMHKRTKIWSDGGPGLVEAVSISRDGKSFIMIDGVMVYEGGKINGFMVHKIAPDRVVFVKDGRTCVQEIE